jgi:SAM-dependent methyltransferase
MTRLRLLRQLLAHPLAVGLDEDDPRAPAIHGRILREKPLLRRIYEEWYAALAAATDGRRPVLEIGAGAGFLRERIPHTIGSDLQATPAASLRCDARHLPVRPGSLGAIVMTNALHHVPDAGAFLHEAARSVRRGGRFAAIEPWVTPWSRWVYQRLHHEPFEPDAPSWTFPARGPLSGANGALPWIVFARDGLRFEREHPEWSIVEIRPGWPTRYLLSGGMSMRTLVPAAAAGACRALDRRLERHGDRWGMFALIVLERR